MKLSEQLKQDHDCGDFGEALAGRSEMAEKLERALQEIKREREKLMPSSYMDNLTWQIANEALGDET